MSITTIFYQQWYFFSNCILEEVAAVEKAERDGVVILPVRIERESTRSTRLLTNNKTYTVLDSIIYLIDII
jgi:hypothetical protein